MPLDYARLKAWREPSCLHAWSEKDTILYALGLGLGSDPRDPAQVRFVYEPGLAALPTMATVLAANFGWLYRTGAGIDPLRCVHGEQSLRLHRPLPAAAQVRGELAVTNIVDKGPGLGAVVHFERTLHDTRDGALLATLGASMFCRGHGGFGGPTQGPPGPPPPPERPPDDRFEWPTYAQQALMFRQNGDRNPIHSDPQVAAAAGFPRPILHGLCTFGIAAFILIKQRLGWDPAALESIRARFVAPLFPGETLELECWDAPEGLHFRGRSKERGLVTLDQGLATAPGVLRS